MTNLNKEPAKFCRFSSIQRPSTTQKRFQKYSTQPSLYRNDHLGLNHLSDDFLIEKLKTVISGQDKPICNHFCEEIFNVPSTALKSHNANKQEIPLKNSSVNSFMKPRQLNMLNYQVDCMHLQKGLKDERIYYKKLLVELDEIEKAIPNTGLSCTQKFELKKKYLQEYLYTFFRQTGRQCNQKSLYIQKLWESMKQIFQTLIQKLVSEIKSNEKKYLHESHSIHIKYQQKFEEFQLKISQKNQEVEKFKQIISKLSIKNWKKSKKNRQISQGIVQIVGKLDIVEKQRDYLQSEYVNMLTLGYQGGMDYEEAKKFTLAKFNIQKQANKQREKQELRRNNKQNRQQKKQLKRKIKRAKKSMHPQKLYKMKQKYIYGPNRNREMPLEDNSDEQFYSNIGLKNLNCKVQKKCPQKMKSSGESIKFQLVNDEENIKTYLNKRTQTTVQLLCSPPKIQKQCRQTNFGITQKYRDNFIRNKEIQTEPTKTKRPNCYNCASQYNEEDFLNNFNWTDKIKQQNIIQESGKIFAEEYTIKWMRLENQKNQYKNRENVEQQPKCILQKNQGQVQEGQKLQNKQTQQQEFGMKIEEKKMKRNNAKVINKSTHYKKNNRPSIFKRNSLVGAEKRISLVDKVQKIQQIGNKNKRDKIIDKNNYIQQQESQIYSKNSIKSIQKHKQTVKNSPQSQTNLMRSYLQMERGQQTQADHQSDYYTTDMLSVLKNMSKLTPKGIYIDETMLFLLKKSLFKIKHDTCDNVFNQNYEFIIKARQSVCVSKNTKNNVGGVKNFMKIIGSTYDMAILRLCKKRQLGEQHQHNVKGVKGQKIRVRHESFRSTISKSHRRTQSNSSNIPISDLNFEEEEQTKINLVSLMRESIKKQYPLFKTQQIENKMISLLKSVSNQRNSNYQLKNFMLLSCLEENIFSTVIFDNDIEFYFALLLELNIGNYFGDFEMREDKQKELGQKSYKLSNFHGSYQNCFTNIKKLKWCLPVFIKKHYKKQSLVTFIQHRISDTLQKIRGNQSIEPCQTTRLDIFKCSQLIMQSLFSFKLDILKSFAQLTELECLSPNNLISQQLLIDILGFIKMSKLEKLNTVNKFRYDYGKNNTIEGINLIYMVNFCIKHNLPDFDEILYDVLRRYPTTVEIQNKIVALKLTYTKFSKLQNICLYLHSKNLHYLNNQEPKDQTNHKQISTEIQLQEAPQQMKKSPSISTNSELKNQMKDSAINFSLLDKQLWDIIGVKASNCLIHCKVVQLQSSQLLEYILGDHLITIYMASLCQLEEKKYLIKKGDSFEKSGFDN